MQQVLSDFRRGAALTDDDLRDLIREHRAALSALDWMADPRYSLVRNEILRDLLTLEGFRSERRKSA